MYKGIYSIILFIICIAISFGTGYFLCDRIATRKLEQANNELAKQQSKYDELIRTSTERIREAEDRLRESNERISNITNELFGQISGNEQATTELSTIIEQIRNQKFDLQI